MFDFVFVHVHINYSRALFFKNHENTFFHIQKWETHHIFIQLVDFKDLFKNFPIICRIFDLKI